MADVVTDVLDNNGRVRRSQSGNVLVLIEAVSNSYARSHLSRHLVNTGEREANPNTREDILALHLKDNEECSRREGIYLYPIKISLKNCAPFRASLTQSPGFP